MLLNARLAGLVGNHQVAKDGAATRPQAPVDVRKQLLFLRLGEMMNRIGANKHIKLGTVRLKLGTVRLKLGTVRLKLGTVRLKLGSVRLKLGRTGVQAVIG